MIQEHLARRADYRQGVEVVLADGRRWSLPAAAPDAPRTDPELRSLLKLFQEAEDRPESLRAGLALTILLLTRNYDLSPEQLRSLLTFPPDDPRLTALRESVDRLASSWIRADEPCPAAESRPRKSLARRSQLAGWLQRFGLWTT